MEIPSETECTKTQDLPSDLGPRILESWEISEILKLTEDMA